MNILDRIASAEEQERGIALSAAEVADLADEIAEMELQRHLDAILFDKTIRALTGANPASVN